MGARIDEEARAGHQRGVEDVRPRDLGGAAGAGQFSHRAQVVGHVARMAGGVAQARDAGDLGEAEQEPAEAPAPAVRSLAMPRVDVLTEERQLACAGVRQPPRFRNDSLNRARNLGAAGVGHDAEGAELVAAFLHGEEGVDLSYVVRAKPR